MSIFLLSCNRKWGQPDPHLVLHLGILVESLVPGETGGSKEFSESIHISYWILRDWGSNKILWLASEHLNYIAQESGTVIWKLIENIPLNSFQHPIEKGWMKLESLSGFCPLTATDKIWNYPLWIYHLFFSYINEGLPSIKIFLFYIFSKHCIILLFSDADVAMSPC